MTQSRNDGASEMRHGNTIVSQINAAFFHSMDWYMHWKYAALKSQLFSDLPPVVVEIGAGAGANVRYLRPGAKLIAIEPNTFMHPKLATRARRYGVELEIHASGAEQLPLPDSSVDAVVASLVLCTVADPEAVAREIVRVLRPGGRFVCVEHVAAPPHSFVGWIQRKVHRPWRWFFEGCHTHRDTGAVLERAGFTRVAIEPFTWRSVFIPVRPQIAAVCAK